MSVLNDGLNPTIGKGENRAKKRVLGEKKVSDLNHRLIPTTNALTKTIVICVKFG